MNESEFELLQGTRTSQWNGCYKSTERVKAHVVTGQGNESMAELLQTYGTSHRNSCYRQEERVKGQVVTEKKNESGISCYKIKERIWGKL